MALQEELNQMLRQGQRECLHLKGLIRKLKSAQALLQMRKDEAKKDLEGYVNKLSESLIEFRSEMHVSIRSEIEHKNSRLTSLREKYETDIQSYTDLCDAAEKLMYFGKSLNSETDRCEAKKLLQEFSQLMQLTAGKDEIGAVVKFEFYPALPVDNIIPSMFGDLVIGSSVKPKVSPLSVLAARKSKCDSNENAITSLDDKPVKQTVSVEKVDQSTQTDKVEDDVSSVDVAETYTNNEESLGYKIMQCDQQYTSYQQTSPTGYQQVQMQYRAPVSYSNLNPPPGFSVYQRQVTSPQSYQVAGVAAQPGIQVNPYMMANTPTYQGSRINQWYTTLATPTNNCQDQNTYLCDCTQSLSPESTSYLPSQQWYTGVPLVNRTYVSPILSPCPEPQVSNFNTNANRLIEKKVQNIPLPMGPMPKENSIHYNSKMDTQVVNKDSVALKCDKKLNLESVEKQIPDKIENDTIVTEMESEKVVNGKGESSLEMKELPSDIQRFEKLLNRTNELLEESNIDDNNETNRKDEAFESEIEKKDEDLTTVITQDKKRQKVVINSNKDECNKKEYILKEELVGLKLKFEGDEFTSPVKPLRRPLRLPKICLSQPKMKSEPTNDSSSSVDSGIIATENVNTGTNDNTTASGFHSSVKQMTEPFVSDKTEMEGQFNHNFVIKQEKTDQSEYDNVEEETVTNVSDNSCLKNDDPPLKTMSEPCVSDETEKNRHLNHKLINKPEKMDLSEYENVEEQTDNVSDNSGIKNEDISEVETEKELLDLSVPTGTNLRDVVKSKGPSQSEIKELNKLTLQSQTKWLKGYLQQMLPENQEKEIKPKITDENNNSSDECWKRKTELNPDTDNVFTDNVTSNITKTNQTGETKQTDENCETNKGNTTDRKTDVRNLKSAVKGFLGGRRESSHRSTSTYSRLGALQAHWLKNSTGTDIKAKFLFSCSEKMHFPIGVTTNSLQQIIIADTGNHSVKMFDTSGKFIRVLNGQDMRRPSAVVVNEFDHIFVKDDVSIKVFDNLGDFRMNIDTDFNRPFGLVLTPAKYLLVLDADRRHPALVHVSQDGHHVLKFPYTPLINAPPGSKCRFMAVSENHVLVSDLGLSQIYISDFHGLYIKVIGSPGFEPQQFFEPSGISVDNYGNIVIGDSRNNRVQVYRHDGSFTGLIDFDDKITRPSDIHLTSDNKLIVVNFLHHNIKVYQLLA